MKSVRLYLTKIFYDLISNLTCQKCRQQKKQILSILNSAQDTILQITKLSTTLADVGNDVAQLKDTVNTLGAQMTELKIDNENLSKKVGELLSENVVLRTQLKQSTSNNMSQKPKPSLVIGSSMIRDLEPINNNTLDVKSISGATLNDINKNISEMVKTEPDKYNTTYIVARSIDCESTTTTENITDTAREVINIALKMSDNVVLSSILPRTDNGPAQLKGENLNLKLKTVCDQTDKVTFCDNDGSFRLANGSPNDALLMPQGHHLNFRGSEQLIKNLNIPARVRRRQPTQPNPWRSYPNSTGQSRRPPLLPSPSQYQINKMWNYRNQPPPNLTCTNCNLSGHTAYSCPKTANILCYQCRSVCHRQKDCLA